MSEPIMRRKFVLASLMDNHNKEWLVELWADGTAKTTWGRVGETPSSTDYHGWDESTVRTKIREKERKGYRELELHRPSIVTSDNQVVDADINQLVNIIFQEANESIASTLATSVDALSVGQIQRGRSLLAEFQAAKRFTPTVVEDYYNTIPTQLGRKIDVQGLTKNFNPADEETRLDQLEAALSTYTSVVSGKSQYSALGCIIKKLDTQSPAYLNVLAYVKSTGNYRKLHGIYSVRIPAERDRFDQNPRGKDNIASVFHGTRNPSVRHILVSGLRVPRMNGHVANGSRFGLGIYFADKAARSMNYTSASRGNPKMMFVVDAALGRIKDLSGDDGSLRQAPTGYDSVRGVQSYSGMDEIIVYDAGQSTIRFIVTFE